MGHSRLVPNRQALFREACLALLPVPRNLPFRAGHGIGHFLNTALLGKWICWNAPIYGASLIYFMQSI